MHKHSQLLMATHRTPRLRFAPLTNLKSAGKFLSLALLSLLVFTFAGCRDDKSVTAPQTTPAATPAPVSSTAATFDGQRAFEQVRKQVEFGPRPAGSAALAKTRDYIISELKTYGLNVLTDEFTPATPTGPQKMVNITAELQGESNDVIIISSHYDTKLFKDLRFQSGYNSGFDSKTFKEFDFVGANDGASSTGVLMELARALAATGKKPKYTYWFVFFDGEEAFCAEWDNCKVNGAPDNTYGSRHFVEQLKAKNEQERVRAMILLDMVGYTGLEFTREAEMSSKWLIDIIWQAAREKGYAQQFVDIDEGVGGDDHEPFLRAGIDAVDIIQLNSYPYWHKASDTLDKISPRSLQIVGEVVLASLPRIEEHLANKRGG